MRKYIVKRILISIVILFFVGFIIYALMRCLPTSFIENMARQKSMQPGSKSFDEWMEQLKAMYNMDKNIIPGYFAWLGTALRGEFGDSWLYTVPVLDKFNDCVWLSFVMGGIAFVLEILIAVPLGVIAATKQYSRADYTISIIALAGISLPTFFFASLLKLIFSEHLVELRRKARGEMLFKHRSQNAADDDGGYIDDNSDHSLSSFLTAHKKRAAPGRFPPGGRSVRYVLR